MITYKEIIKSINEFGLIELYNFEKAINQEFIKRGFMDRNKIRECIK